MATLASVPPILTPTVGRLRLARVTPRFLGAASAVALGAVALPAVAQQTGPAAQLPPISVEGDKPAGADPAVDYRVERVQSPKFTEPLLDVPQTINVVPQSVIEERASTTLRDVLRTVPGVTANAGEGGTQGDNFRIRGFAANTDMFVDGMRDLSQTTRDPFNLEQVEIFKGPSSSYTGRGSTGGSLNQVSKSAKRENFQNGSLTLGTDATKRATMDLNQSLDGWMGLDGAAIRLNAMGHMSEVEGRDYIEQNRWGFAPTVSLGMNKPTRLTLSYFHMSRDDTPDYGLPLLNGKVVSGTKRTGNYGLLNVETDETETDVGTVKFEHDFGDDYTLRNQLRYGVDTRYAIVSPPRINAFTVANGLSTHNASNAANLTSSSTNGANGGNAAGRDSTNELLINQTDLTSRFDTGFAGHTLVTGIELARETYTNAAFSYTGVPATSLYNPNPFGANGTRAKGTATDTEALSTALYAFDTVKLGEQWELVGGLRWDYFDAETTSVTAANAGSKASRIDRNISYRAAVVYKPIEITSIYVSHGTSFNPSAEALSLSTSATSTSSAMVAPEKNKSYEIGNKWDVLDKKLSLTAAAFRTIKTNARTDDGLSSTSDPVVLEGEQRVHGLEFGATGAITDKWKVYTGYTYMSSRIESSKNLAEVGNPIAGVPRHSYSLWTTYQLPADFEVGMGATHVGRRTAGNSVPYYVDDYTVFDAMVGYHLTKNVDLQLNILNLADEFYLEQVHAGGRHAVPGAGRTALFTTSFKF
jgi:catecholate siderophore receptor